MKKTFLIPLLIFSFGLMMPKAQLTAHTLINVGYTYQNHNFGEVGGRLLLLSNDDVIYRVGASALFGSSTGDLKVLPKVQGDILFNFEKGVDFYHSYYFLLGAEATTKYIAPKAGISLFGLLDLTGGYGFSLDSEGIGGKPLEGLNIGVSLNLPVVMLVDLFKK